MVGIKSTSNSIWWIKNPKKLERRSTLSQDMTDLFRNISLHGYNKLLQTDLFIYEKLIWFCLHVINLAVVITVLSYTWDQFVLQYFTLNLNDPLYPIENIPFPSVSICSNNRISRQAAEKYAYELSKKDPRNKSAKYFINNIKYFNSLYYKFQRVNDYENFDRFQSFLDIYATDKNETYFNTLKTIKMLTPNCSDLIVKCFLNDKEIECFGDKAFEEGLTMYGPCCTFNSNNSYGQRNSSYRLVSPKMGLNVLLNSSHPDDVVSLLNMNSYVVIVHNPHNFPDIVSGSAIEVFPMNNEVSFIAVKAKFIDTIDDIRTFDSSYRKCYFDDESPYPDLLLGKAYSLSNCISRCRIRSISVLCNCVPFYTPVDYMQQVGVPYCSLHHVACIERYSFKWRNVLTTRIKISGLEREVEEGLYCLQCLPSCDDVQYDISMMSLPIDRLAIPENVRHNSALKLEDLSVLRVYFGESTALYYKREISNTWEDVFSTVGNIVSIFLGFSVVALYEILYFVVKYTYIALKTFIIVHSEDNSQSRKTGKKERTRANKLYILP